VVLEGFLKALSDVTYRIEEERMKAGEQHRRKVVHFNWLKPCFTPPPEVLEKPPQAAQSESFRNVPQRNVLMPSEQMTGESCRYGHRGL